MNTPVVFIHGLWIHATSWQPWIDLFRESGYEPVAPEWPGGAATVQEARAKPEAVAGYGVTEVADHYAKIIGALPAKPIVIGHSFGGLLAQVILGRNLAHSAVAIDAAPIKGVLALPFSALRVASVALKNPANLKKAISLTPAEFRYGFGNQLSAEESEQLYRRWTIPSPARPLFQAAFANFNPNAATKVDTANATRGPLLLIAGEHDHTVPPAITHGTLKLYHRSPAITELKQMPNRGHSLTIDKGWREVAETVLSWLKPKALKILVLASVLGSTPARAQQFPPADTTRVIMVAPAVQIRGAMVLGLVSHSTTKTLDPRFAAIRAVAESLGFGFSAVSIAGLRVVDTRYQAVYSVPEDVRDGYMIIAPGRRPDLVRGYVEADSLRRRIASYLRLTGPLATH